MLFLTCKASWLCKHTQPQDKDTQLQYLLLGWIQEWKSLTQDVAVMVWADCISKDLTSLYRVLD